MGYRVMAKNLPKKLTEVLNYQPPEINYNKHKSISFSQFSQYFTCPHQWSLNYVYGHQEYTPSIHTVFGTALHETVQEWLDVVYNQSASKASKMDLESLLETRLKEVYRSEREKVSGADFTNSSELLEFYQDGLEILKHLNGNRGSYFPKKKYHLAGIELPLVYPLINNVFFKGYIDLIVYSEVLDKFTLIDLKTSKTGWNSYQKKDEIKTSQLLLYKYFFSETFDIPLDSIDIMYMVVRRKINEDYDFTPKRVQKVVPASGKIKMGKVKSMLDSFVRDAFSQEGSYLLKEYKATPSKSACRFCTFNKNSELCSQSYKNS